MTVVIALIASAYADPTVSQQPLSAPVDLPEAGVVAIAVPLAMRHPDEAAADYVLVGPTGEHVPFVWVVGGSGRRTATAAVQPTLASDTWLVTPDEPVDGLTIELPYNTTAQVHVRDTTDRLLAMGLTWRRDAGTSGEIALSERSAGPFRVAFAWVGTSPYQDPSFTPWIEQLKLAPLTLDLPIGPSFADDNGTVWRGAALPNRLPLRRVRLDVAGGPFDREIRLVDGADPAGMVVGSGRIFRSEQQSALSVDTWASGWDLLVGVDAARGPTLDVTGVHAELDDARLLVRDVGPGPFVLHGGRATGGHGGSWDLEAARDELMRADAVLATPGAVVPNASFVPPEVAAGLVEPGAFAVIPRYRWRRDIVGAGLVEIPIPAEVLAHSNADLADVRVVDADGMEIPRTLVRRPGARVWEVVEAVRTEVGTRTVLRIALPQADVPLSAVRISSDAPIFSRPVSASRPGAVGPEVLRYATWTHDGGTPPLQLGIEQRVGDVLLVEIENDRDAPLPLGEVAIAIPAWSLITQVPPGGAALVYGDRLASAPDYDLALVGDELQMRRPTPATLGEPAVIERPALSWWDSGLLMLGLGVASLGLLAITARIALATPEAPAPPAEARPAP